MPDTNYLIPLLLTYMVGAWIGNCKYESEQRCDFVMIHQTRFYSFMILMPMGAVALSLIINFFVAGFLPTLLCIGFLAGMLVVNKYIIFRIYCLIFGFDGIGTLLPMIAIIPLIIWMFIAQFS